MAKIRRMIPLRARLGIPTHPTKHDARTKGNCCNGRRMHATHLPSKLYTDYERRKAALTAQYALAHTAFKNI